MTKNAEGKFRFKYALYLDTLIGLYSVPLQKPPLSEKPILI